MDRMRVGVTVRSHDLTAVLVEDGQVRASTRAELAGGLRVALRRAVRRLVVDRSAGVYAVTVDVGPLLHAVLDRPPSRVAVLRLARPHRSICPPGAGWPDLLAATVSGGHDLFGVPLAELDRAGVAAFAARAAAGGVAAVAVTAAGAVLSGGHEVEAAEILAEAVPGLPLTLSHQLGGLGLAYRENATILNAALRGFADRIAASCEGALRDLRLDARLGFAQGDAALANAEHWRAFPVLALGATTAVTLTGAGALAGTDDAVVVIRGAGDWAIGQLTGGWPVTGPHGTLSGGQVVAVPTPDVRRVAPADLPADRELWPAGDVVVAAPPDAPAIAGGHVVDPATAAATGAALARPAVTVERLVVAGTAEQLDGELNRTRADALARLVSSGADPASTQVLDAHVTAIAYLAGTVRVQVRAVGRAAELR